MTIATALDTFGHSTQTATLFGAGCLALLGEQVRVLGASSVLVVTDPGLVAAGHVDRAETVLRAAGLRVERFDATRENPTDRDVADCSVHLAQVEPELLIGLGGGSAIDTAKGANFLHAGGGVMADYWGVGKARGQLLPLIAVPTTAGTGTEVQSFALIERTEDHQKMACGDAQAAPRLALLDPELCCSMPRFVTACTGIDAIGHALEAAVTTKRGAASTAFARAAFRLAAGNFERVLAEPEALEARAAMLAAAAYAGMAIEHSMLGAAHSMANPLTARCGLPHGQAVGMVLPAVVAFNSQDATARAEYAELARAAGLSAASSSDEDLAAALIAEIESCLRSAGFPPSLQAAGVQPASFEQLAREAAQQWTAQFNPREVAAPDFEALYAAAG